MNPTVTIRGNVGGDPVRSALPGGASVVRFRVAINTGYWDRRGGHWIDGGTNWYNVSAFRQLADHATASLRSGDAVIVTGTLKQRDWQRDGRNGVSLDLDAESIGHDMRYGTSVFARTPRGGTQAPPGSVRASTDDEPGGGSAPGHEVAPTEDVWSVPAVTQTESSVPETTDIGDEEASYLLA